MAMSVSQTDLNSFHFFASEVLGRCGPDVSLEDLVKQWHAQRERDETIASVRRGVDDAAAGRLRDAAEVDTSIRMALGLPARN
jgi:hypothetical protein